VFAVLEFGLGIAIIGNVLYDVFQSIVVPRPTPARFRIARFFSILIWPRWRALGLRLKPERRDRWIGAYAPVIVASLLVAWVAGLILGYGLVLFALAPHVQPEPKSLWTAMYFAGVSLLTIGYGDIVATGGLARLVVVLAGVTGLGVVALAISFIFSLYSTFQRREAQVLLLDARAGAPPSGVNLLETVKQLGLEHEPERIFIEWERWAAEVLDTHLAYPLLAFFRSSHDNESWVSALGAVLDAATLVMTTLDEGPKGEAKMLYSIGQHLVDDLSRYFGRPVNREAGRAGRGVAIEREEFDQARDRLAAAGYKLLPPEQSWARFSSVRSTYADSLNAMARFWAAPPAQWIGDRSYVRHRPR